MLSNRSELVLLGHQDSGFVFDCNQYLWVFSLVSIGFVAIYEIANYAGLLVN
jgi:hypothetical protein